MSRWTQAALYFGLVVNTFAMAAMYTFLARRAMPVHGLALIVYTGEHPDYGKQILAWRVTFSAGVPEEVGWYQEAVIDARTGEVYRCAR